MSHNTTSGGGRVIWRLRAISRISPPWRRLVRMVRRRSMAGPIGSGRLRRVRRRSSGSRRRLISCLAALISAALMASKSMVCRRSRSLTVSTASICGGSSFGLDGGGRLGAIASATRLAAGGGRSCFFSFCASISAIAAACSATAGSRQNNANACSNTSACSWRWIIAVRNAVRVSPRLPRSTSVTARCAARVSDGPTGSPARRSSLAKCRMLAPRLPSGADPAPGSPPGRPGLFIRRRRPRQPGEPPPRLGFSLYHPDISAEHPESHLPRRAPAPSCSGMSGHSPSRSFPPRPAV